MKLPKEKNEEFVKKVLQNLESRGNINKATFLEECICVAYRLGLKDEFNFENQKCGKTNKGFQGCNKAVFSKKRN